MAENTVVPACAQVDVSTKLVYNSLDFVPRKQQEVWGTESTRVKDGLLVARTIVPDKVDDVPVRVLNTTSAPVVVSKGTLLSNLQPLVPMEEATPAPPADGRKADLEIITDMLACIDDYVPLHLCDELRELLHNYSDVFSKDEWDLGRTNVVTHRIDTGCLLYTSPSPRD